MIPPKELPTSKASTPGLNPEAAPYVSTPTASNLCAGKQKAVLLQTARTHVFNSCNPHNSIEVRILMDSGSQRSYNL